jgi:2-polyprenyl-3-methyl-5-hydroxy-6-metoxy-1,4-benzoquinol methylase
MSSQRYEHHWSVEVPAALTDPLTAKRREFLWSRVASLGREFSRLLDCGAGDGSLVADAHGRGMVATGLEISGAAIERAHANYPGIDIRRHSVEELPWPVEGASWDIVVSFEVIEHLLEPRALLRGAHSALVPGGALAVSTPYHGLVKNLGIAAFRFDSHFGVDGEHVRFFTDKALRVLLSESGFEVVEIVHLGRYRPIWANTLVWARKA